MAEIKSLKDQILERLNLKQGGADAASANIRKASHDFAKSDAPQFQGRSQKKRHQMAVAAGLSAARGESAMPKSGDKAIYENKKCVIRGVTQSGMATIRFGNNRELIVRATSLKIEKPKQLNESILGMGTIAPTYRGVPNNYGFIKLEGLDPEDIGLIFEDDDEEEIGDEQEEAHDNGSNIRQDGHTGKKEVDELPTPSDTIAPAYSDEKPPKEISSPLSTHIGAEEEHLWDEPEWDGYDYPADAPEIPTADFLGSDMGNARAPHFNPDEHQAGDGQDDREGHDDGDGDEEEVKEGEVTDPARKKSNKDLAKMRKDLEFSENFDPEDESQKAKFARAQKRASDKDHEGKGSAKKYPERWGKYAKSGEIDESFFMSEMDDLLGHGGDTEPGSDATITVTLSAMAAIMCTVANKVGGDQNMLKAMVEALAEVSKGKTIDIGDLDAVASHINGEELPEVENRAEGKPDHEGIEGMGHEGGEHEGGEHEGGEHEEQDDDESWPGDGETTKSGKTKLMGGMGESITENRLEFYGGYDVLDDTRMTEEEEIALVRRRAFPNGVRRGA